MEDDKCPNADRHTKRPKGLSYLGFFSWADEKSKTHKQTKCPGCGLYKIWVPKNENQKT